MPMMPQGQGQVQRMALGSGFIIDPSGYVVTNNHVVENADKVTVVFQDGSKHPAKIIGRDEKTDLALLKIDAPKPLPYVAWGDSNASHVGDWVLAVGNPFGLGGTVSTGIISARGRDIHEGPYDDFLQIDASINRGNSGGPTFSLDGKVIGINTAIYSPNGGSVGIGFAIPASLAKPVIEQLKAHGTVERGWLGVQIQEVTPELASSLHLPKAEGALVADVTPGGPAQKIGIKQGDVILSYDGHEVGKLRDLPLSVAETPVGETAHVELWRDGKQESVAPVIAAMPAHAEQVAANESGNGQKAMGLSLASLTPELRERLHVGKDVKGVVVTGVAQNSPLATLGIEQGDVIEQVNRHAVATPEEAAHEFDAVKSESGPEKSVLLLINRHGVNQYVAMTVEQNGGARQQRLVRLAPSFPSPLEGEGEGRGRGAALGPARAPLRIAPCELAQQPGDALRHHIHEGDEDEPVDRRGGRVGDRVGDVRHELDEDRAEHRARNRRDAADDDADHEKQAELDRETVGRHELRHDGAERAGDSGEHGADAERRRFVEGIVDAHGGGRQRMVADRDERAAGARAQQVPADDEERHGDDEAEEIEPLVAVERQVGRRIGLGEGDALDAAGPLLDVAVFQDLRRRDRERECREREIHSFEAQGGQAEQESGDEADRAAHRHRRPIGDAGLVEQDRRRIGADREERAVAQRHLAVEAGEDVEPQQHDRIDDDHGELEHVIAAQNERQDDEERAHRREPQGRLIARAHTRVTRVRPKRPEGRSSSTPTMMTSATVSLISVPTT